MIEERPTTHKNNGGEDQKVNQETQRFEKTGSSSEHASKLKERLAEVGFDQNEEWAKADEITTDEEVDVIIDACKGLPVDIKKASNLPMMRKAQKEAEEADNFPLYDYKHIVLECKDQALKAAFAKCEKAGYEPKREKKVTIILGFPASGKSTVLNDGLLTPSGGYLECDSDTVKECQALSRWYKGGLCANKVASVSAEIQMEVMKEMMGKGYNIAIPIVGRNYESTLDLVDEAAVRGYKINIIQKNEDPRVCAGRLVKRYAQTGRFVGLGYLIQCMGMCPGSYKALKTEFDRKGTIGGRKVNGFKVI